MQLTKNDLARVIHQALYNLDALPAADNPNVQRRTRLSKKVLLNQHEMAVKVLRQNRDRIVD